MHSRSSSVRWGIPRFPPQFKPQFKPPATPQATLQVTPQAGPSRLSRVLLIGINYYNTPYQLEGCINDVITVQNILNRFFPTCKNITVINDNTAIKPTRSNILTAINNLVKDLKPGENIYFHYSGHGGQIRDTNGDEVSGYDDCIYPYNNQELEIITDDELRSLLAAKVPAGSKCFIVLDSCHSGTAVDLRYLWQPAGADRITYAENTKYSKLPGTVFFLSGCSDQQTAEDTADNTGRPCGALTWALCETWKKYGAAIKIKHLLWDVRQFLLSRRYSQTPQLSSGNYFDMNSVFNLSV